MKYAVLDEVGGCEMIAARDMAREQVSCYEGCGPKRRQKRQAVEPLWVLTTGFIRGAKYAFDADGLTRGASLAIGLWMVFEVAFMNGLFLT